MSVNNFIVRQKRKIVGEYGDEKTWASLGADEELVNDVAGMPSEPIDDD